MQTYRLTPWTIVFVLVFLTGCRPNSRPASQTTLIPTSPAAQTAPLDTQPVSAPSAATEAPVGTPTTPAQETGQAPQSKPEIEEFPVPSGSHPHDVAPAPDGSVWYTAQASGELGRLDPQTGETRHITLGKGPAPHGVFVDPDGAPWITDGGLNAIVRVDPVTEGVQIFPLPVGSEYANLNTAAFDAVGTLWFTGQGGLYGRLDPAIG